MSPSPEQTDDASLLLQLEDGNEDALGKLYDRFGRLIFSIALRIVRDRDIAADVTQDTFVKAWNNASMYDPARGSVQTWISVIGQRAAIDTLRRIKAQRTDIGFDDDMVDTMVSSDDTEQEALGSVQAQTVRDAMDELPAEQRTLLELAYFRGMSQSELSEQLGIPLGTVKTRMFHGLRKLREKLGTSLGKEAWS